MTKWIELREKIRKIYGKHNRLILAVVKFILALFLFLLINHYVGYTEKLHHVYIAVALALICAMLPVDMTVLLAAVFTVVHLYALSMEVAVTALLIFLLMFFLFCATSLFKSGSFSFFFRGGGSGMSSSKVSSGTGVSLSMNTVPGSSPSLRGGSVL